MNWQVRQTKRFARTYKKLHDNLICSVDSAIAEVASNPCIGEKKKGDLSELWVHKFRCQGQLYLLGYTRDDEFFEYAEWKTGDVSVSSATGIAALGMVKN
jgi:mRNA-degrading endonuclease RelE of RelBE toxin-antitoxin system